MTLSRTGTLKRHSPMPRGEGIKRTSSLKATKWGTRPKVKAKGWRDAFLPPRERKVKLTRYERAYMAFVRSLGCCCAHLGGCRGKTQASHATTSANEKGWGMKVPTENVVPHCDFHHRAWDGRLGNAGNPFAGWTKEERYARAQEWTRATQFAAIPDDREAAETLERWGLGTVLHQVQGDGWAWLPGSAEVAT